MSVFQFIEFSVSFDAVMALSGMAAVVSLFGAMVLADPFVVVPVLPSQ